jgi:hypothetical protein
MAVRLVQIDVDYMRLIFQLWIFYVAEADNPTVTPSLRNVISSDKSGQVVCLTSIGNRLFVLRNPNKQQIETFDTDTFEPQKPIQVDGLNDSERNGMTSCIVNRCLFICDFLRADVHRVNLSVYVKARRWPVDRGPCGLSVNAACNVLVTCHSANKIQEYTGNGSKVREISLVSSIQQPMHAVQCDDDRFVIIGQRGTVCDVVVVDSNGRLLLSYIDKFSSIISEFQHSKTQNISLSRPRHLAVDKSNRCI